MKKGIIISILLAAFLLSVTSVNAFAAEELGRMEIEAAPSGLVIDASGVMYVTDVLNKCVWSVKDDEVVRYAGGESPLGADETPLGGYNDSSLTESLFMEPWGIAPFLDGWAISDTGNNAIRLIHQDVVETVNAQTTERWLRTADGSIAYDRPTGLATDMAGNLYVANTGTGVIIRITPDGQATTWFQGLKEPTGLFWYQNSLYIAETGAHRVVKLENGKLYPVAGSGEQGFENGKAGEASFSYPTGVTVDSNGVIYVADTANAAIRRIENGMVDTLLGPADDMMDSMLVSPRGLLVNDNELLICDTFTHSLLVLPLN